MKKILCLVLCVFSISFAVKLNAQARCLVKGSDAAGEQFSGYINASVARDYFVEEEESPNVTFKTYVSGFLAPTSGTVKCLFSYTRLVDGETYTQEGTLNFANGDTVETPIKLHYAAKKGTVKISRLYDGVCY